MILHATERVIPQPGTTTDGQIEWDAPKSLGWFLHAAGTVAALPLIIASAVGVMLTLTAVTICAGHSVGMHRLPIHRAFATPLWLERILIYLGSLVGMAGPFGMIRAHDMRVWHQRQGRPPHPFRTPQASGATPGGRCIADTP